MARQEPTYQDTGRDPAHLARRSGDGRSAQTRQVKPVTQTYGCSAQKLLENGYEPLPIRPGKKAPAPSRWSSVAINHERLETWTNTYATCGVGLRTGRLVGLDINVLDPDEAHQVARLAERRLGATLTRVGLWPKRLLLYRTKEPFRKMKAGSIEFLGLGQQFVAFGRHPDTGRDYYWPDGETPLEVALGDLPLITDERAVAFLAEAVPAADGLSRSSASRAGLTPGAGDRPVRDASGLVVDGRDGWLSRIVFHEVHDALDRGVAPDVDDLTARALVKFRASTDLTRGIGDGVRGYEHQDVRAKVRDKLRLARSGDLPARDKDVPAPSCQIPTLSAGEGRAWLEKRVERFCDDVQAWHSGGPVQKPALDIRATVGLGKSTIARSHLLRLMDRLRSEGLPHRVLVFTPSHELAEETAAAWKTAGAAAVVARGYERTDPATGEPMCRDLEAVHAALSAGLKVHQAACAATGGARCAHFHGCHKQANLRDVASADVVVAPYDALFSGLAFDHDDIGLLVVDEGCWARALDIRSDLTIEDFRSETVSGIKSKHVGRGPVGAMNDLHVFRQRSARAFDRNGPGHLRRNVLVDAGLTADDCRAAASLERRRERDPDLQPGMGGERRKAALADCQVSARIRQFARLWAVMADFLNGGQSVSAQLVIGHSDGPAARLELRGLRGLHENFQRKPVLHLDATLRPELARTVLPDLAVESLEVAAPHMHARHVTGSFGKSMLCPDPGLSDQETRRRANRLRETVDYVRWHARRVFPAPVLVVTYKAIEDAFSGVPNVQTAHFNAVAGLDIYKDVALLISIGRPLPSHRDLELRTGPCFDHVARGHYEPCRAGIRMRAGPARSLPVFRHSDRQAEILRAAICDDELVQVVGRGRGVNRTADDPLEVHILADVALPLVYDHLTAWAVERPDIVQRMLLEGIAVDSPADARALHPALFGNEKQAQKEFERVGFKRQNPMNSPYREMSLKSAAYKRPGRGRSWQRAWWIDGCTDEVRALMEKCLGVALLRKCRGGFIS